MPVTKQAKKKQRRDIKKRVLNAKVKKSLREAIKKVRSSKNKKDLSEAYGKLDKSAKLKLIHKNKASRLKSRLAKTIKTK